MILDRLVNTGRCSLLHPGFKTAFDYLRRGDWRDLRPGKHEIDGVRLYVNIITVPAKPRPEPLLEFHREFIDIQYAIEGTDRIGWEAVKNCAAPHGAFDAAKDVGFFKAKPATWGDVPPGCFAVFFPEDAHAPLAGTGPIRKAVVKVAVNWKRL